MITTRYRAPIVAQFVCDDCGNSLQVKSSNVTRAIKLARQNGFAISKDKTYCWCDRCALAHKNLGRGGANGVEARSRKNCLTTQK